MPTDDHLKDANHVPRFVALSFDGECVESDDDLAAVLKALARAYDADDAEELCVWKDGQAIAAVMRADGDFVVFEPGQEDVLAELQQQGQGAPKRRRR